MQCPAVLSNTFLAHRRGSESCAQPRRQWPRRRAKNALRYPEFWIRRIPSVWFTSSDAFTAENRAAQATVRDLIWQFYADLKAYRCHPTKRRKTALRARFDRIFTRMTGFVTLDRLLMRLNANKPELLMVLDRPETPLHTNGSENDIRCHVTRRKVSGGTRSDVGRDCRDAFLGLAKTCAKLGIAFWDYLAIGRPRQPCHPTAAPNHPCQSPLALTATTFAPLTLPWKLGQCGGSRFLGRYSL